MLRIAAAILVLQRNKHIARDSELVGGEFLNPLHFVIEKLRIVNVRRAECARRTQRGKVCGVVLLEADQQESRKEEKKSFRREKNEDYGTVAVIVPFKELIVYLGPVPVDQKIPNCLDLKVRMESLMGNVFGRRHYDLGECFSYPHFQFAGRVNPGVVVVLIHGAASERSAGSELSITAIH